MNTRHRVGVRIYVLLIQCFRLATKLTLLYRFKYAAVSHGFRQRFDPRTHQPGVQGRLRHRHRVGVDPARPLRGRRPAHLLEEERARVAARVAAEGLPPLAHDEGADLAERPLPADRLPGRSSTTRPRRRRRTRRSRSTRSTRSCSRPTRSSASRCASGRSSPASPSTPSSTPSPSRRPSANSSRRSASSSVPSPRRSANHPELVKKYLGSVVPYTDNFFATLNSAVFSDGSFCYIPKGVRCPMELSTYFRINSANTGQFERTLIVAEEGAYVSYLEGCTAPIRDENQLHAAVVELVALDERRDQVLDRPELVPRRQGRQGRHLQLRHQARHLPRPQARRSPGRRSRPAPRSPGSTRAASCRATTRSASSTRSPSRTTTSRPTPARR